jgi:hypothetical protein
MGDEEYAAAVERVGVLMEPWQGALPSLYAATSDTVTAGGFYSPDEDGGYRGYPAAFAVAANASDEATARKLWEYAVLETGVHFPG